MSKRKVSAKNIISVYQFMDMCGLKCNYKENTKISHEAMMKKLNLRHKLFPYDIMVPSKVYVPDVENDEILKGDVVIVRDDYKKNVAYRNPLKFNKRVILASVNSKRNSEIIEPVEEPQDSLKPGYIKYLTKKSERQQLEKLEYLKQAKEESNEEASYMNQVSCQKRLSLYCRRGFGRR